MLHAVIMAGGSGTRFWPESRHDRPKQLLSLVSERSMLQTTVDRLGALVPPQRVLVVTSARLVEAAAQALPGVPREAILGEPCRRDTAPCIGLAAFHVLRHDAQAVMAVMPADHVIEPASAFQAAIAAAAELVASSPGRIVTFGIRPSYPAESFGYIERGEPIAGAAGAYRVARFREKPKGELARQFCESGRFYWNSGIFVWQARTILDALQRLQPALFAHLAAIDSAWDTPRRGEVFEREFAAIEGISIDYAVMEQATDVAVIEAPFSWDDVGSWQAMARQRGQDADGNTLVGKHVGINTRGSIVRTTADHLVATLGLVDCIVVHTPTATLVANKHDEEAVRELVKRLEELGWREYL